MSAFITALKAKLVSNWKQLWKFHSIHIATLITILSLCTDFIPHIKDALGTIGYAVVYLVLYVLLVIARILKQNGVDDISV